MSLSRLSLPGFAVSYHFIDDNHNEVSKELLERFARENDRTLVETLRPADDSSLYMGHIWTEPTIWKVACIKTA